MWTWTFWKDALERAVSTFAQTLLGAWGTDWAVDDVTLGWEGVLLTAGIAAGFSLLKSVAASRVGQPADASLVK